MNTDIASILDTYGELRTVRPLVQCITNFVSMDVTANVLNAAGASPAMVHDPAEAGEFAAIAGAVVANIGTPSPRWVEGMRAAVSVAHERGTPWVLDPVAVGATSYRRATVAALLAFQPTVIRGNASEILSIASETVSGRGVDSDEATLDTVERAVGLARRTGSVVAMTGKEDVVTDGRRIVTVRGGDDRMPLVTALGCSVTALVAACCAVQPDALIASVTGLAVMGAAAERAGVHAAGPGSLRMHLLDELAALDLERLAASLDVIAATA